MNYVESEIAKIIIIGTTILVAIAFYAFASYRKKQKPDRHPTRTKTLHISLNATLLLLAVFSSLNYYRCDASQLWSENNGYDLFHYYLTSKYFDELGYNGLYNCAIAADFDFKKHRFKNIQHVRNLTTYEIEPRNWVNIVSCKESFSPTRWKNFKRDVRYFQKIVPKKEWKTIFIDRGCNATPVWLMNSRILTNLVPAKHVHLINKADVALFVITMFFVFLSYGLRIGLFSIIFFTTLWATRWPILGQALLRFDWICALITGMCLLKKRHTILPGILFALSFTIKLFPAIFMLPLIIKALRETKWSRGVPFTQRFPMRYVKLFSAYAIFATAIVGASTIAMGGPSVWRDFAQNMKIHTSLDNVSYQRTGFAIASGFRGETDKDLPYGWWRSKKETLKKQSWIPKVAFVFVVILLYFIVPHLDDDDAVGIGFLPFFTLLIASYYYLVVLWAPALVHMKRLARFKHTISFVTLLTTSGVAYTLERIGTFRYALTAIMSIILSFYCLFAGFVFLAPMLREKLPRFAEPIAGLRKRIDSKT